MARQVFISAGGVSVPIEVDQEGMRTDRLAKVDDARLCYVTPSHQFPLGSVMSAARRQELLAWARRTGAYIVEDDYDSEYRYDIRPIEPLQTAGGDEHVIYLGTSRRRSRHAPPRLSGRSGRPSRRFYAGSN